MNTRLLPEFFMRDVLDVAPELIGKKLVRCFPDGSIGKYIITEVEAYRGTEDLACHASKGRTPRTEVMFGQGGTVYVYLIYGQYWLLNLVTGCEGDASAVLIRGFEGFPGPGRVGRELQLDKSFYGENLITSQRIWVEDAEHFAEIHTSKRIGIGYSGDEWVGKLWRYYL
ncbi:MAG: DNA-3-methyladenine glycosylase [Bacteroidota bacterium]|nr:DNA-3-methyladenine glycosylase [Bacteroidota bacterium]MDO9614444.1 DNA-3-methyladenine glycosylase [Bacteroidota bacterium]